VHVNWRIGIFRKVVLGKLELKSSDWIQSKCIIVQCNVQWQVQKVATDQKMELISDFVRPIWDNRGDSLTYVYMMIHFIDLFFIYQKPFIFLE
jgi:hypothetical protein